MKICYNCFHKNKNEASFCEECGYPLSFVNAAGAAAEPVPDQDAMPCGETLYGRYMTGRVLQRDEGGFFYTAQDSRSGETVVLREYFPKETAARSSMRTVSVQDDQWDQFQEGKEAFLDRAEALLDREEEAWESGALSVRLQSFFSQNNTAYMVFEYDTPAHLQAFLTDQLELGTELWRELPVHERIPAQEEAADEVDELISDIPEDIQRDIEDTPDVDDVDFTSDEDSDKDTDPETAGTVLLRDETGPESGMRPEGSTGDADPDLLHDGKGANTGSGSAPETVPAADPDRPQIRPNRKPIPLAAVLGIFGVIIVLLGLLVFMVGRLLTGLSESGLGSGPSPRWLRRIIWEMKRRQSDDTGSDGKKEEKKDEKKEGKKDGKKDTEWDMSLKAEGISAGNFYNRGRFVLYGDDYYYSSYDGVLHEEDLTKEGGDSAVDSITEYMNLYGNHIYYPDEVEGTIVRYDPETEESAVVYNASTDFNYAPETLYMYGGWCYFSRNSNLYRLSVESLDDIVPADPDDVELVTDRFNGPGYVYESLCFVGDRMVYNGNTGLVCAALDGSDAETLADVQGALVTDGESIYCWHGTRWVDRISLMGDVDRVLEMDVGDFIATANFCDGYLYIVLEKDEGYQLCRMNPGTGEVDGIGYFGQEGDLLVSLAMFPDAENAYAYLYRRENDDFLPVYEEIPVNP